MQTKINPKVSVVIPVYNREKEVYQLIKSLNSQTYDNFEVIFVDDFSSIPLQDSLDKYHGDIQFKHLVIRNPGNKGVSYSRNQGVNIADGEYIAFLDSDDSWFPEKLAENVKQANIYSGTIFCMSKTEVIKDGYSEVLPKSPITEYKCGEEYLFEHGNFAQVSSFFLSRELAEQLTFNQNLVQYEDFLYFIEAFNHAENIVFIDKPLVTWNNLQIEGRLSLDKNYTQATTFLEQVNSSIGRSYLQCFYLRFVMPYYFYRNINFSLTTIYGCLFNSSIAKKTIIWMTVKGIMGDKLISRLRMAVKK
ncbi:glycosyltransferase family 2 protein [Aliiglaciecola sp. 2_MG-2023]|uniref:glycosyltransferase family 2 protein n=1 Tax=unclassified Aliiglaciecola TaxID=2593648 RepID=UPI0026E38C5E|nr:MULTISPECIES: glycosyltransferase family 2 protein [unclassified Aliiglaciecola]MDO6712203.1 glycosyltransferase family 2 protein [Aliiglaciecola sp. 2_MG-2023]MDO6753559.1 glycosyltransferase family 2 protein [Aliiglaciecola sp. 1_MG-2023]